MEAKKSEFNTIPKDYFELIVENSGEAILLTSPDGSIIYANKEACRIFERTSEEICKIGRNGIVDLNDSRLPKAIEERKKTGRFKGELNFIKKDGTLFPCEFSSIVFKDENGNERTSMIIRDISEQKKLEDKEKELSNRITHILENIADAFVSLDNNWCYTYMNKKAGEIFGRNPKEMIGKHIWTEFPEGIGQPFHLYYEKAMLEQRFIQFEEYYLPYDKWFENRIYPSKEGISIFFQDITERKRVEKEIKTERDFSNSLLDGLPGIFYFYDSNFHFLRWNKNFETVSGYSSEEISKMRPIDFFSDVEKDLLKERIGEVFTKGYSEVEANFLSKDGTQTPYFFNGLKIRFNNEDCLIGVGIDIAARKKAEESVIAKHELFKKTFNISPLSSVLTKLPERTIVEVNPAFEKLFGYSNEEIIGKSVNELNLWADSSEREQISQILLREGCVNNFEFIFKTKSGETGIGVFYSEIIEQLDEKYALTKVLDITERKQAENSLVVSENRYRSLFENMNAGFVLFYVVQNEQDIPVDLIILAANEGFEKTTGLKLRDSIGKHLTQVLPGIEKDEADWIGTYSKVALSGESAQFEQGSELLGYYYTISAFQAGPRQCAVTFTDITERKNAERELNNYRQQLEKLNIHLNDIREDERALISREIHDELGQSLTALKIDLNTIREKTSNMTEISKKLESMTEVVSETIKNVQRISSELRPGILDDLGVAPAIEWYSEEFENRTGIKCIMNIEEIYTNNKQKDLAIYRLLQESLTNVIRHSKAKKVDIRLFQEKNNIILEVADDGIGFDIESIKSINSLGLFGMKERVKQFNGNFIIETEKSKGTKISILIPIN